MPNEQYVFIGGHRKSGTTMLLNLFDGHPQCCVYPTDISVLYGYFPVYTDGDFTTEERLQRLEKVVFGPLHKLSDKHGLGSTLDTEAMKQHFFKALDHNRLTEIDHIIRTVVDSFRIVAARPVDQYPTVILKETSLEIYAHELSHLFPEAQFIQLLRDPRDNYAALLAGADKHYKRFGENEKHLLASLIHRVGLSWQLVEYHEKAFSEKGFKTIHFEDLTADAETTMKELLRHVGVQESEDCLTPTVMGVPTSGNNYDGEKFTQVTKRNVNRWQERIGDFEAQVIEFHLGQVMARNGYANHFDPQSCARAASEFYKWTNYRYFFKDSFALL